MLFPTGQRWHAHSNEHDHATAQNLQPSFPLPTHRRSNGGAHANKSDRPCRAVPDGRQVRTVGPDPAEAEDGEASRASLLSNDTAHDHHAGRLKGILLFAEVASYLFSTGIFSFRGLF